MLLLLSVLAHATAPLVTDGSLPDAFEQVAARTGLDERALSPVALDDLLSGSAPWLLGGTHLPCAATRLRAEQIFALRAEALALAKDPTNPARFTEALQKQQAAIEAVRCASEPIPRADIASLRALEGIYWCRLERQEERNAGAGAEESATCESSRAAAAFAAALSVDPELDWPSEWRPGLSGASLFEDARQRAPRPAADHSLLVFPITATTTVWVDGEPAVLRGAELDLRQDSFLQVVTEDQVFSLSLSLSEPDAVLLLARPDDLAAMIRDPVDRETLAAVLSAARPDAPEIFAVTGGTVWRLRTADRSWEELPPPSRPLPRALRRTGLVAAAAAGSASLLLYLDGRATETQLENNEISIEDVPRNAYEAKRYALMGTNTIAIAGLAAAGLGVWLDRDTALTVTPTWSTGPGLSLHWRLP